MAIDEHEIRSGTLDELAQTVTDEEKREAIHLVTSAPDVRRTRAIFLSAEFGFLGVAVWTRMQTPRRCGAPRNAGVRTLPRGTFRPLRTSC